MNHRKNPLQSALRAAATFTLIAASVNSQAQTPPGPPPAAADVPIREVVLFSSGVGYFQHEGNIHGDAATELRFKTGQINDILKSLVLNDVDGGHIGVVTYPSQDPLDKTLASFQVNLSDNPSLGDLLAKLRGARVSLIYRGPDGQENIAGTVLGVEKKQEPGGKDGADPIERPVLNLVTRNGIRALELEKTDRLDLDDPDLRDELNRALAAVAGARDQDKKPVDIRFNGQGDRHVRIGYVVETPIWKASYRLVLPDKTAKNRGMLQGWAIVENQTDNDWRDVRLSLVSGRPISFVQDLYQPLYVPRPTVVPELYASLRPQEYDAGQADAESQLKKESGALSVDAPGETRTLDWKDKSQAQFRSAQKQAAGFALAAAPAPPMATPGSAADKPMNVSESIAPLSDTAKVGELFQYTVGNVSLARQKSAMIPIINDPIEAEKVSIYNQGVFATHPLNGARLKNTTADDKHLSQGPVTVFDGGRYAGDARLDDVGPGETRLLSYGVDLQMGVIAKDLEGKQAIQTGKIVKGVLQVTRKYVSAKEYSADNKAEDDRTLVIEHPLREGWKLVETPAPVETTDKLYRFQEAVAAGKTEKFTVREETVQSQSFYLMQGGLEDMAFYSRAGEIPAAVRDALVKVAARRQAVAETQRLISEKDGQINGLSGDQNRIRENIRSVDRTSAYATRLLKKLDDQESQLERLHGESDTLHAKLDAQNRDLSDFLNGLNVD